MAGQLDLVRVSSAKPTSKPLQRVRYTLLRREVEVVSVTRLSPGFTAITFTGPQMTSFESASFDDHVKFMFTDATGNPRMRDYTPRAFNRLEGTVTLEFALHEHGPASDWARSAHIGMQAYIGGPKGSVIIPPDCDWHLLAGDASALPAIARRLEELPANRAVRVVIRLEDPQDQRAINSQARAEIIWTSSDQEFLQALEARPLPGGEGFVWGAGEASLMRNARDILIGQKGHPRPASKISAYWRRGTADFHEKLSGD